jgi:tetratricopeptide (TPR) repeat protein
MAHTRSSHSGGPALAIADSARAALPRGLRIVALVLLLATLALQIAARGSLRRSFWGFHQYAYLPGWAAIVAWVGLGGLGLWVLLGRARRLERAVERLGRTVEARPRLAAAILALACGAIFWLLRSHQTVLGDGWPLLTDLPKGVEFHTREPLAMWLQQRLLRAALALTGRGPYQGDARLAMLAVAVGSVVSGALFAFVAAAFAGICVRAAAAISHSPAAGAESATSATPGAGAGAVALLVALVLLAQGYAELFYGYIENYAFPALALGTFLTSGVLSLQGRLRLLVPLALFLFLVALHVSNLVLAPALMVLAASGLRRAPRRALVDLVLAAGLATALHLALARLSPGYSVWAGLLNLREQTQTLAGGETPVAYFFTLRHVRDFVNCQQLLGPLGAALLLPVSVMVLRRRTVSLPCAVFLGGTAWLLLAASAVTPDPTLGYARDWDAFAPAGVAYAAAAIFGMASSVRERRVLVQLLLAGLLLSLMHTAPWVAINHSEPRSIERLADLPLGHGRTEVAIGFWHLRNGRSAQARPWFARAAAAAPYNVNAQQMLGHIFMEAGQYDSAASAFGAALRIRPDKLEFHAYRAEALMRTGRYAEAVLHTQLLCDRGPGQYHHWLQHAVTLEALQRADEARHAYERALSAADADWSTGRHSYQLAFDRGLILIRLGRLSEGVALLEQAVALQPDSQQALFDVSSLMIGAGNPAAARPHLERLLQLYPGHPMAQQIREWLAHAPGP